MNEIERAIENFKDFLYADVGKGDLQIESIEIALAAIREKQEREKGFGFCNTGAHRILSNALYCPRCGKRLEENNGGENHNG